RSSTSKLQRAGARRALHDGLPQRRRQRAHIVQGVALLSGTHAYMLLSAFLQPVLGLSGGRRGGVDCASLLPVIEVGVDPTPFARAEAPGQPSAEVWGAGNITIALTSIECWFPAWSPSESASCAARSADVNLTKKCSRDQTLRWTIQYLSSFRYTAAIFDK
ncbi:hypothetical protein C8J57DRAFT_1593341, partial [Mycena rebaudengoi]